MFLGAKGEWCFCFSGDWCHDVLLSPVVIGLVKGVFEVKIEGNDTVKEVSQLTVHWMVTEGDAVSTEFERGLLSLGILMSRGVRLEELGLHANCESKALQC